jgi:hypothetical protein
LANPVAAANAMVYFQLRHMWRVATIKMEQFGRELKAQREKRERKQLHSAILAKRERRQQAVRIKLEELQAKRTEVMRECKGHQRRFDNMNPIVRLFSGQSLRGRIQAMQRNCEALDERIREFNDIIEKIQGEPLPEPDGLSLESRRLINVAVIALAQHLVLHFEDNDLARLARKASKRSVADMKFGERRVCDQMVERIRERIDDLNRDRNVADQVKCRADELLNSVAYRNETDATPMRSGLTGIERSGGSKAVVNGASAMRAALAVNVLEDDYWELAANLL